MKLLENLLFWIIYSFPVIYLSILVLGVIFGYYFLIPIALPILYRDVKFLVEDSMMRPHRVTLARNTQICKNFLKTSQRTKNSLTNL